MYIVFIPSNLLIFCGGLGNFWRVLWTNIRSAQLSCLWSICRGCGSSSHCCLLDGRHLHSMYTATDIRVTKMKLCRSQSDKWQWREMCEIRFLANEDMELNILYCEGGQQHELCEPHFRQQLRQEPFIHNILTCQRLIFRFTGATWEKLSEMSGVRLRHRSVWQRVTYITRWPPLLATHNTGAIRKKLREMSGVQLRHQYVLCNNKKNKRFE
jgi:hypothetical protein